MGETRARRRIREAIEGLGWVVTWMEWEPVGPWSETGPDGGWHIHVVRGDGRTDVIGGTSADDAIALAWKVLR